MRFAKQKAHKTADISKNLTRLSGNRTDIFGAEETEESRRLREEEKRKQAERPKVIWDGFAASAGMATEKAQAYGDTQGDQQDKYVFLKSLIL